MQRHAALYEVSAAGLIKHLISLPFPVIAYVVPEDNFGLQILEFGLITSINKGVRHKSRLNI